jgi:hypothetical protein
MEMIKKQNDGHDTITAADHCLCSDCTYQKGDSPDGYCAQIKRRDVTIAAQATAAENKRILGGDIDWEEIGFGSGSDLFDRVFKTAIMSSDDNGVLDTDKFIRGLKTLSESLRAQPEPKEMR